MTTAGELNASHIGRVIHVCRDGACSEGRIEAVIHFSGVVGINVAGGRMFPQLRVDQEVDFRDEAHDRSYTAGIHAQDATNGARIAQDGTECGDPTKTPGNENERSEGEM